MLTANIKVQESAIKHATTIAICFMVLLSSSVWSVMITSAITGWVDWLNIKLLGEV